MIIKKLLPYALGLLVGCSTPPEEVPEEISVVDAGHDVIEDFSIDYQNNDVGDNGYDSDTRLDLSIDSGLDSDDLSNDREIDNDPLLRRSPPLASLTPANGVESGVAHMSDSHVHMRGVEQT